MMDVFSSFLDSCTFQGLKISGISVHGPLFLEFLRGKINLFLQIVIFKEKEFTKFYFTIFHIYQVSYFTPVYFCFYLPGHPTEVFFAFFIKRKTSLVTGINRKLKEQGFE